MPCRRRAILEHMAKMARATLAADLDPPHAVAAILDMADMVSVEGLGEAGPARAGLELCARSEQRQPAEAAGIDAILLIVQKETAEGSFRAVLQQHPAFFRRQAFRQLRHLRRPQGGDLIARRRFRRLGTKGLFSWLGHQGPPFAYRMQLYSFRTEAH